ncbi:MAG TPA: hypothetical protein VFL80_11090 [Thermoanaerobaculia bacterium]|nr:hypothetical protein [Thermoanaerobaculia bacterium]
MRKYSIVLALFLLSSTPSWAFSFGPERPVSSSAYGPPMGEQRPGATATDGTSFMVFWSDNTVRGGLYATRVASTGEVSPVPQVPIRSGLVRSISAVWTGSVYLVTWADDTSQSFMAATLSREGTIIKAPYVVATNVVAITNGLATNGRRAMLVYLTASGLEVRAALFDSEGNVLRSDAPLPIEAGPASIEVASDGDRFGIVWSVVSQPSPVKHLYRMIRINDAAESVDATPVAIVDLSQSTPMGLSYGGGKWGFALIERQVGEAMIVRRFTIDGATRALETLPAVNSTGFDGGLVWNGSEFVSYWTRLTVGGFDLVTVPFSQTSVRTPLHRDAYGFQPILEANSSNVLAVWLDRPAITFGGDVGAVLLDRSASNIESGRSFMQLAVGAAAQEAVAAASSPTDSLVVWTERRGDADSALLLAARVGSDGSILNATPVEIATDVPAAVAPEVAFTGQGYYVVWTRGGSVFGRFLGQDGTLGETTRLGAGYSPAVAANASVTLVVFDTPGAEVALHRLSPRGVLMDTAPLPFTAANYGDFPRVASNGTDFFVVWTVGSDHWLFGTQDAIDVLGARVRENGSVDAVSMKIASGPKNQSMPAVASDGRDYLVAYLLGYEPEKVVAIKRVLSEGALATGTSGDDGLLIAEPGAVRAAVVFVGDGYVVGWHGADRSGHHDVKLARLGRDGAPSGTVRIDNATSVALADSSGAGFLLAYARYAPETPYVSASRAFVRVVHDSANRARAVRRR